MTWCSLRHVTYTFSQPQFITGKLGIIVVPINLRFYENERRWYSQAFVKGVNYYFSSISVGLGIKQKLLTSKIYLNVYLLCGKPFLNSQIFLNNFLLFATIFINSFQIWKLKRNFTTWMPFRLISQVFLLSSKVVFAFFGLTFETNLIVTLGSLQYTQCWTCRSESNRIWIKSLKIFSQLYSVLIFLW